MIKLVLDLWILKIDRSNDCIQTPCDRGELYGIEKLSWMHVPMTFVLASAESGAIICFCSKKDIEIFVVKTLDSRNAKQMK